VELDKFIEAVLIQVLSGIRAAQELPSVWAFVVSGKDGGHELPRNSRVSSSAQLKSTIIGFDVAISVDASDKVSGTCGLKVAGIGAAIAGETGTKDTRVVASNFGFPSCCPKTKETGTRN
jgi:hypothetical protein